MGFFDSMGEYLAGKFHGQDPETGELPELKANGAIDALDNQNKPVDSISDEIDGYGSLLYGPPTPYENFPMMQGAVDDFTGYTQDRLGLNVDLEPNELASPNSTYSDDWDPWEGEDEYGMTEEERMQDESDKMGLYGTTDLDKIKRHNRKAYRRTGGDNTKWLAKRGELWKAGLTGFGGLMGLSQNQEDEENPYKIDVMSPFQYNPIGQDDIDV
jgi:hypothetical protein